MAESFGFDEALKAVQSGQAISGKGGVFAPLLNVPKKWTMPIRDWKLALNRFMIEFEDRLVEYV